MRILFVGFFHYPWSSNVPLARELKNQGHNVKLFDFRMISLKFRKIKFWFYIKIMQYIILKIKINLVLPKPLRKLRFYILGNYGMNKLLVAEAKKNYDLIILAKADGVNYDIIPILNKYSKTWYYFMDPVEIAYQMDAHKYAAKTTWGSGGSTFVSDYLKKKGCNSFYINEGFDPQLFSPSEENKNKEIDVIFVGSANSIRKEFIHYLLDNQINVVCYGKGWKNKPVYMKSLVEKYRISKIILNFPRIDSGFSDRVYQALGTGSFLLSKYSSDFDLVFKKSIHLDWFKTKEECLNLIKYYLQHEEKREKIALEGFKYVLKNFTWASTTRKIIQIVTEKN